MKIKNQFLIEKQNYNGIEITTKSLAKSINGVDSLPVVSIYDKKTYGVAYNFKVDDGILYCDMDIDVLPDSKIAVVPELDLTAESGTITDIQLRRCLLTYTPIDVRNIIWITR